MTETIKQITIYSQSAHIVESIEIGYKGDMNPSVDPSSIVVTDDSGFVPFSYFSPNLNKKGKDATVVKGEKQYQGRILSLDDNIVVLSTDDESVVQIRNYDDITISDIISNLNGVLATPGRVGRNGKLSYIIPSILWNCMGIALIDENTITLILTGHIQNNTDSTISGDISLMSGKVFQPSHPRSLMYAQAAAPMKMSTDNIVNKTEDYTKYKIGRGAINPNEEKVVELGTLSMPTVRFYEHRIGDQDTVRFGYRFTASQFIPQCSLNIYSVDNNKRIHSFLGTSMIKESQTGEMIDIFLGESTKLQCSSSIKVVEDTVTTGDNVNLSQNDKIILRNKELHLIREEFIVDITNYNTEPSFLVIRYDIGPNKKLLEVGCRPSDKTDQNTLEWYFTVPAGTANNPRKDVFACNLSLLAYQ